MDDFDLTRSVQNGFDKLFDYLPQILGALALLLIGYFIAIGLRALTRKLLKQVRFDRALHTSPAGNVISRIVDSPSRFVSKIVFWLVFLGFVSLAVSALNLPALNDFLGAIYGYLPHVIAAVIIFLVASAVSVGAAGFVRRVMGRSPLAKVITTVIPSLVMSIATFMILSELQIAEDIVNITYTALVGAIALGLALAFGLGGRDVASRLLEQAYQSGRQNVGTAKEEARRAAANTKREANKASDRLQ